MNDAAYNPLQNIERRDFSSGRLFFSIVPLHKLSNKKCDGRFLRGGGNDSMTPLGFEITIPKCHLPSFRLIMGSSPLRVLMTFLKELWGLRW
jgi:hypothetical protein